MDVGEENGVNILAVVQVLDILFGLEVVDREIGQHMILQCFAVGQETDDLILLRILELGHQRNALVAGSVDQDIVDLLRIIFKRGIQTEIVFFCQCI